jgi:hypothetical protein
MSAIKIPKPVPTTPATQAPAAPPPAEESTSETPGMERGQIYSVKIPAARRLEASNLPTGTVIVVPPKWRERSFQKTVIRHDPVTGKYFVDEYLERMNPALINGRAIRDGYRPVRSITCPEMQFSVALTACNYYCEKPCRAHIAAIETGGWWNRDVAYVQKDAQLIAPGSLNRRAKAGKAGTRGKEDDDNDV